MASLVVTTKGKYGDRTVFKSKNKIPFLSIDSISFPPPFPYDFAGLFDLPPLPPFNIPPIPFDFSFKQKWKTDWSFSLKLGSISFPPPFPYDLAGLFDLPPLPPWALPPLPPWALPPFGLPTIDKKITIE